VGPRVCLDAVAKRNNPSPWQGKKQMLCVCCWNCSVLSLCLRYTYFQILILDCYMFQASMDLPPDKAKLLKQYDDEKKWDIICDQVSAFCDV
jgi:hypothetical protein